MSYSWTQTDGPIVSLNGTNSSVLTFTAPNSVSALSFALVVTDSQGLASMTDSVSITVQDIGITGLNASNNSPTHLGQATVFTASISAGSAVSFTWHFGDGAVGSGITATHTYTATGNYAANVVATNSAGSVSAQTVAVVVMTNEGHIFFPLTLR